MNLSIYLNFIQFESAIIFLRFIKMNKIIFYLKYISIHLELGLVWSLFYVYMF